ncbi:MAG TPA: archaellin/type IV pilin N-terminal domain-containing protein, partial [Candidatus Thermoplasmatota archaeon]|nr:archaellin/type IV pilin N-terminal domain-containing protein [Candidatus Thermoplasmatota archaeon]
MRRDAAVSPVVGTILMVAITVVLAATVYVWVSGFGGSGSDPAKTISLSSGGAIKDCGVDDKCKTYTIAGASPGLKYEDIKVVLNGVP